MTRLFLVPAILCLIWWIFLRANRLTIKQGAIGFYWICGLSAVVWAFFAVIILFSE